jgi:hypothetical protein
LFGESPTTTWPATVYVTNGADGVVGVAEFPPPQAAAAIVTAIDVATVPKDVIAVPTLRFFLTIELQVS